MGNVWTHDLPDLFNEAGIKVILWPGWELRSRASGGYDQIRAIGTHHTASNTKPENDCGWMWVNTANTARPIGACLLDRNGTVWFGAAGATNCVEPGSAILTRRGILPIEEVRVGDEVLTHLGRWRRVTETHRFDDVERVRVKARGVPRVVCTPHHPLWAYDGWSKSGRKRYQGEAGFVQARDLTREHLLATPTEVPATDIPDFDGMQVTYEMMRVLGAFVADGYVHHSESKGSQLWITPRSEKSETVKGWCEAAGFVVNQSESRNELNGTTPLRVGGTALARWVHENFGAKSITKTVPAWLLGSSDKFREAFLEGYLHGDGYWNEPEGNRQAHWVATTSSRCLAAGLRLLGASLGFHVTATTSTPPAVEVNGRVCRPNADRWDLRFMPSGGFEHDGLALHPVRSVETHERGCVYDLTVDEDHSYIVDGIVSHNTQGKGGPVTTSKGVVPLDAGNRYFFSIEAANRGNGEVWPNAQIDSYERMMAVVCMAYGLDPTRDIFSHASWSPGRKVDPSGPTPLRPSWGGLSGNVIWPDQAVRWSVAIRVEQMSAPPPPPEPEPEPELPPTPIAPPPLPGGDMQFEPITPRRVIDTRGGSTPRAGETIVVALDLPSDAKVVAFNLTAVRSPAANFLTVWSGSGPRPPVSNLSIPALDTRANFGFSQISGAGTIHVYTEKGGNFLLDVFGYFK